ncbi:MAG: hypothetical protein AAGK37_17600 [Pseudomonadota bacterium]
MTTVTRRSALLGIFALSACSTAPDVGRSFDDPSDLPRGRGPAPGTEADIAGLSAALAALGSDVNPEEAARAARISYVHTYELAQLYEITDPALIHNHKVNTGTKPRGLCNDWAEDMEKRLVAEDFSSLQVQRAIGAVIGIDHSTVIITRPGDSIYEGIVVDPWRRGGRLTWIETSQDTIWGWEPQFTVHDRRVRALHAGTGKDTITYVVEDKPPRCLVLSGPGAQAPSTTDLTRCIGT